MSEQLPTKKSKFFTANLLSRPETEIRFRTFKGSEEKEFLIAAETKDEKQIESALMGVLNACTDIDEKKIEDIFSPVDLQMLLIKIRKYSKGESFDFAWTCPICKNEHSANAEIDVDIEMKERGNPKFAAAGYTFRMKVPSVRMVKAIEKLQTEVEQAYALIAASVESIIDSDEKVYDDFTLDKMQEWLEDLESGEYREVLDCIRERLPSVTMAKRLACPNTECDQYGKDRTIEIDDFRPFLA